MLKPSLIALSSVVLSVAAYAQPAVTTIANTSQLRSIYELSDFGPQRTELTRENKYPGVGNFEVGGYFNHIELTTFERDTVGVESRYGLWDTVTVGADLPYVLDTEFRGESDKGIGDVVLTLDLLAYQDIFRYPFIIPHIDVSLPTGDEDIGAGTGETIINLGVSVGTVTHDVLTWVIDFTYGFNGAAYFFAGDDNLYAISGSLVWDISDRLAILGEGRFYEEIDTTASSPYEILGGFAYKFTPDLQLAIHGGILDDGGQDDYTTVRFRVTASF